MLENVGAWNGTGGFWKCWSRENIGVRKDVRRLQEMSEMSECRIGKHWSMENVGVWKTSETSEYGIGRHQKHRKCWSVKYEWKFRAEFKIEYGYITKIGFPNIGWHNVHQCIQVSVQR